MYNFKLNHKVLFMTLQYPDSQLKKKKKGNKNVPQKQILDLFLRKYLSLVLQNGSLYPKDAQVIFMNIYG